MSSATTENARPLSPAWAAMIEALSARRFVSPAISSMTRSTSPMRAERSPSVDAAPDAPPTDSRIASIPSTVPETAVLPAAAAPETRSARRAAVFVWRSVSSVASRMPAAARAVSPASRERFSTEPATSSSAASIPSSARVVSSTNARSP